MLRSRALAAALVAASVALPSPARAWDDVGHMTIALIAWRHMTPAARTRAVALLRAAPPDAGLAQLRPNAGGPEARDVELFARASTWPDLVRDRRDSVRFARYHHPTWHYLSWYWRADSAGRPQVVTGLPTDSANVVERLERLPDVVGDRAVRPEVRAVALAWVLHLAGDVHQPLHTASRVAPEHLDGDRGGNAVRLTDDGRPTNLHAVWDDLFDTSPRRGRDAAGADATFAQAERAADGVEREAPARSLGAEVAESRPEAWAREGQALDERAAYTPDLVEGGPLPDGYRARARTVATPRAALAGYRLAALLNRELGGAGVAAAGATPAGDRR